MRSNSTLSQTKTKRKNLENNSQPEITHNATYQERRFNPPRNAKKSILQYDILRNEPSNPQKKKKAIQPKQNINLLKDMNENENDNNAHNAHEFNKFRSSYEKKLIQLEKERIKLLKECAEIKVSMKTDEELQQEMITGNIDEIILSNRLKNMYYERIEKLKEHYEELQRSHPDKMEVMEDDHLNSINNIKNKINKLKIEHQKALNEIDYLTFINAKKKQSKQHPIERHEIVSNDYIPVNLLQAANEKYIEETKEDQDINTNFNLFIEADERNKINKIQRTTENLKKATVVLQNENDDLTREIKSQTDTISSLTNENNAQKQSIDDLQQIVAQLQAQLKAQEETAKSIVTNIAEKNTSVSNLQMQNQQNQIEKANIPLSKQEQELVVPNLPILSSSAPVQPQIVSNNPASLDIMHQFPRLKCNPFCGSYLQKRNKEPYTGDSISVKVSPKGTFETRKFSTFYKNSKVEFYNVNALLPGYKPRYPTSHQKEYHTEFCPNGKIYVNEEEVFNPYYSKELQLPAPISTGNNWYQMLPTSGIPMPMPNIPVVNNNNQTTIPVNLIIPRVNNDQTISASIVDPNSSLSFPYFPGNPPASQAAPDYYQNNYQPNSSQQFQHVFFTSNNNNANNINNINISSSFNNQNTFFRPNTAATGSIPTNTVLTRIPDRSTTTLNNGYSIPLSTSAKNQK